MKDFNVHGEKFKCELNNDYLKLYLEYYHNESD